MQTHCEKGGGSLLRAWLLQNAADGSVQWEAVSRQLGLRHGSDVIHVSTRPVKWFLSLHRIKQSGMIAQCAAVWLMDEDCKEAEKCNRRESGGSGCFTGEETRNDGLTSPDT